MDNVARFSAKERKELFLETSRKLNVHEAVIEKDFWVSWVLNALFRSEHWGSRMIFKGGTSLSKVFGLINRFSEDIDLILDWRVLGYTDEDLWKDRSNTQKDRFSEEVTHKNNEYIRESFIPGFRVELEGRLQGSISLEFHEEPETHVIFNYPRSFDSGYILPQIRLEIGPLAEWVPHSTHEISTFAAQEFPALFKTPVCTVEVIDAERTFWEKATILHQQAMRGRVSPRYSRHYYDLAQMALSEIKIEALNKLDLLKNVVTFKKQFYPSKSAQYDLASPGTLKLLPSEDLVKELAEDYKKMSEMFFGEPPAFEVILGTLSQLEREINNKE